ncbi:FmdB family zinc ribbon protein [Pseudomonas typographi]|uniref:Zinc ribbon domain-containing protein n=1 Tax=Pseudomonas typographi TaxID=2715964 RepID=A0ABR7Z0I3_9PSED|nr:FmdB family zinc ribbon protein [Pseudomonas typographi]MBD1551315.1 zinc ribbon domain-containing protein [Pseudomonas typographi]MBD1588803.1 zinc ribbon domain-containing protein [Pseudomonas typographi]MBD1598919.1 zinc ribbon domain-containing protein [Pseudomonas typographi]
MPIYDYQCAHCGPFSELRGLADSATPCACPACAAPSPRVIVSAPRLALLAGNTRQALDINERSRHEPKQSRHHGSGCGCCGPRKPVPAQAGALKGNSAGRPWMISH